MSLLNYLKALNSSESNQGIWVNPEDPDDFIIRPILFGYNAQSYGDRVLIGSLDKLSFGFQSEYEAIQAFLENNQNVGFSRFLYNGRHVVCNAKAILEAYSSGYLDNDFQNFLAIQAATYTEEWEDAEASLFISEQLSLIIQQHRSDIAMAEA